VEKDSYGRRIKASLRGKQRGSYKPTGNEALLVWALSLK
jgi:hypothetical protein